MTPKPKIAERFWRHVAATPTPSGCLVWTASKREDGYGYFRFDGKTQKAHRVHWWLKHDVWPPLLRHTCDNPPCVNLDHLVLGTRADNVRDRDQRGRASKGTKHYAAKLTEEKVLEARRMRAAGAQYTDMARTLGVSLTALRRACTGWTWKHVPESSGSPKALSKKYRYFSEEGALETVTLCDSPRVRR